MSDKLDQTYTQERLKLVLDSTRLGMWDWNPQTNEVVFDHNWAAMLGLTVADLSMTLDDWSSRVHPDDMAKCMEDIQAHLRGDAEFYENLHRMRHRDGHWVYILDRGKVVAWNDQGQPVRFTGTHADVTPLKTAEFAASLAVKSKERFFSAMSHELRAPLHAMMGIVEQVRKQLADADMEQKLAVVENSGQHLLMLIQYILDAAKIQQSTLQLNPSLFDLTQLLQQVSELFRSRALEKGILLQQRINVGPAPVLVNTDRARLTQILINLVSNALKFTDEGQVTIELHAMDNDLRLAVRDTGRGIADIQRIFQPFFSLDEAPNDERGLSTGLGLSITRELVNALGLTLDVYSQLRSGSVFTLTLPAQLVQQDSHRDEIPAGGTTIPDVRLWPNRKLLVVDDTPINLALAEMMLEDTPLTLATAGSGEAALEQLATEVPDVIITDLHMEGISGLAFSTAVRERKLSPQPVIIASSADSRQDVWEHCRAAGIDDYLEKPFTEEQLLATLGRHLSV
ncbi:MAG: hypothetical protein CML06_04100 [Pseudomonadales bacterium]|nr:hypothetical protein [Pseudomonadales bacterium]